MITTKYFKDCKTLKEGTKRYRELMMKLHPDHGGDHNEVIEMQHQFEVFVKTATREAVEDAVPEKGMDGKMRSQAFTDTLQSILQSNVEVEIIGDWIWVFDSAPGDTFKLTMLGFIFSKKHNGWYWTEDDAYKPPPSPSSTQTPPRSRFSTEDLRNVWGNEKKRDKDYI